MRKTLTFIALLMVLGAVAQNKNQPQVLLDSVSLSELEVTAARYPQSIRNMAAPVQLITTEQLQRVTSGDLAAALTSAPGVQLQSGTYQTMKLTLRGIGSRSQYSTNRTSVYLNDIPLTSGDGTSVFDDVDLSFLTRVEITKGPYSAWYGSGMGGSLRFITRKPLTENLSAQATATVGSYGLLKTTGMVFSGSQNANLSAGISRIAGDGYRQNSSFKRYSGLVTGDFTTNTAIGKLSYLLMLSDVNAFTPSSIDETTFRNNPSAAATNWLNVKGYKAYKRLVAGLKIDTQLSERWSNAFLITHNNYDQYELRPFNILDDKSASWTAQESVRYTSEGFQLAFGVQALTERYQWQTQKNDSKDILTDAQEKRSYLNNFISAELEPLPKLHLSLAANLNFTTYRLNENMVPNRPTTSSRYPAKAIFSPMLGLIYHLTNKASIYASAGHGFSNPTVEESLNSDGMMNQTLLPEQGWTIDGGIKLWFANARLAFQASAYLIYLNDLLVTKRPTEAIFFGENAGSAHLKGVELEVRHQPIDWLKYHISGSLSNNRFASFTTNNTEYAGNQLPGIPHSQLYADVEIAFPWQLKIFSTFKYSGSQFADDANSVNVKANKTVDLSLQHQMKIFKKLRVHSQLTVRNLFNEHYASMILINAPSFAGRPARYFYPALPRHLAASITVKWE